MADYICLATNTLKKICDHIWHLVTSKAISFEIEYIEHECNYTPIAMGLGNTPKSNNGVLGNVAPKTSQTH